MSKHDIAFQTRVVEALIFASPAAVTEATIRQHLPGGGDNYHEVMARLADRYDASSGIELTKSDDRWAFRTRAEIGRHLRALRQQEKPLSRAAVETLAIIAYHQPITRAEIEEIRGVSTSKGTLDILLELGWVQPKGRRNTPGRPLTWMTSASFLDHFGLAGLDALPGLDELKKAQLLRDVTSMAELPNLDRLSLADGADSADSDKNGRADDANASIEEARHGK